MFARDSEMRQRVASLKGRWLAAVGCSLAALFGATTANAVDAADCIQRPVSFDGVTPLSYASVAATTGSKVYLHEQFPAACATTVDQTCKGHSYLLPGDVVAIGKTCGAWSYVQHIGDSSVTEGWLEANRLNDLAAKLPYDDGEPGGRPRSTLWRAPATVRVKLTVGQGVPVCEAYLQRLNQTVFHEPPSCGRPENDQVPGFTRLNRVPLTADTVNLNYVRAYNLTHLTFDGYRLIGPFVDSQNLVALEVVQGLIQKGGIPAVSANQNISAWLFKPEVDIDNDGHPDSVAIWRDFPPLWDKGPFHACGAPASSAYDITPIDQVPFMLGQLSPGIDTPKTMDVFGDPTPLPKSLQLDPRRPTGEQMYRWIRPLGTSIDVFEYRGKYYFDTTRNLHGGETVLRQNVIYAYLRENGATREVCEYQNMDSEWQSL